MVEILPCEASEVALALIVNWSAALRAIDSNSYLLLLCLRFGLPTFGL